MSAGFKELVSNLQGNFTLIAEFLSNPEMVISGYSLTDVESKALLSRDADALAALCGSQQLAQGVLSGAHTPTCHGTVGPPF
jgi:hypothetical protein